jgi:hypothetical protein
MTAGTAALHIPGRDGRPDWSPAAVLLTNSTRVGHCGREFFHLALADKKVNCIPGTAVAAALGCGSLARMQYANSAEVARVGLDYSLDWNVARMAPLVSKN